MTEPNTPVGRYQILDPAFMTLPTPAVCSLCGSHNRPVVTMQLMIRHYGTVMFCGQCFGSMVADVGAAFGFTSIENFRLARDERDELAKQLALYQEAFSGIHADFDTVLHRRLDSVTNGSDPSSDLGDSPAEDSDSDEVRDGEDSGIDTGSSEEPSGSDEIPNFFIFGDLETTR